MKYLFGCILVILFSIGNGYSQDSLSRKACKELQQLLIPGNYECNLLDIDVSPRLQVISWKMAYAINDNGEWFLDYKKKHESELPLPYNDTFGITEQEYNDIGHIKDSTQFVVVGKLDFNINRKGNIVTFSSDGGLVDFNALKIDFSNCEIYYGGIRLICDHEISTGSDDLLHWHGFEWTYRLGNPEELLRKSDKAYESYQFSFGYSLDTNKPVIEVRILKYVNGMIDRRNACLGYLEKS